MSYGFQQTLDQIRAESGSHAGRGALFDRLMRRYFREVGCRSRGAVAQYLLADYKVVVLAISERHVGAALLAHLASGGDEINLDDAAKIVGCWPALQNEAITKDAIFDHVYGVLHAPAYRERFANDLAKALPRIPMAADFRSLAEAGGDLAALHHGYETCAEYATGSRETRRAGS